MTVSSLLAFALRNWKPLLLAAVAAGALWWAYDAGRDAANARHALKQARETIAQREEVIARNEIALQAAQHDAVRRAETMRELEEQVRDYVEELAREPNRDCTLDGRDAERLLRLRPKSFK